MKPPLWVVLEIGILINIFSLTLNIYVVYFT